MTWCPVGQTSQPTRFSEQSIAISVALPVSTPVMDVKKSPPSRIHVSERVLIAGIVTNMYMSCARRMVSMHAQYFNQIFSTCHLP